MRMLMMLTMILTVAVAAQAQSTFVDDFEAGTNYGGWYYNGGEIIETDGGNPGGWLHNPTIDNFAVIFKSEWYVDEFTGDYIAMGVSNISWDARLDGYSIPIEMTILLRNTNGTPADIEDDDYAYFPGNLLPPGDGSWVNYSYDIPTVDGDETPAGWWGGYYGDGENFRPGVTYNDVIANVDRVEIWFWHPAYVGIFTQWNAGLDNISITSTPTVAVEQTTLSGVKALFE